MSCQIFLFAFVLREFIEDNYTRHVSMNNLSWAWFKRTSAGERERRNEKEFKIKDHQFSSAETSKMPKLLRIWWSSQAEMKWNEIKDFKYITESASVLKLLGLPFAIPICHLTRSNKWLAQINSLRYIKHGAKRKRIDDLLCFVSNVQKASCKFHDESYLLLLWKLKACRID